VKADVAAPWLRSAGVVLLCTGISELLPTRQDLADVIMVYLAGVSWISWREPRTVSLAAVCASVFLFDLIFVPPRWGLNPVDKAHFVTFAIMLAVGVLISRLAHQGRQQRQLAEGRARRAGALAELAEGLAAAPSRDSIADNLARAVRHTCAAQARLVLDPEPCPEGTLRWPVQGAAGALGSLCVWIRSSELGDEERDLLAAFAHQAAVALDRCAFEERSLAAQVQAEAERLRSTLLSGISHDFRTPLTTIVGAATSLLDQGGRLDDQQRVRLAAGVRDEAQRLHRLVSDLLELTRLEEGGVQPACEWCPADDLVQESIAVLASRAASHPIDVRVAPEALVWCDPRLLEQSLVNLLDNAVRHTPPGTDVWVAVTTGTGDCVIEVGDHGPGLPRGSEAEVFRKFHRGGGASAGGGTGLGLAICAAVARVHGGRIHARSSGTGACFTMTLPQPPAPPLETA
jgi:two-component system sensor histidine kinase KdpD